MKRKRSLGDLALFGGSPAFTDPLHVGRPNVGNRDKLRERIDAALDRRWLTNEGPLAQELERRLAAFIGVRHCIAVCNATVALEIAIRAVALEGEVIVPSFTFIATAHALQWQRVTPVFCDVDPRTHNIDPRSVVEKITPRTTGIIGVHLWGRACDVVALKEIAERHRLRLLFDAAHAFACSSNGTMIGNFGDAEIFSFHATKFFNTFEGGAIATNDDALAAKIRLMKNFGFAGYDNVTSIGTNGKLNEISAAMGLTGLEALDEFIAINARNFESYRGALTAVDGLRFVDVERSEKQNFQYVVLEIDEEKTGISRDRLSELLWAENVKARRYFYPGCHAMEPYRSLAPAPHLPATERLARSVLVLPTGTAVGHDEIETVSELIRFAIEHAGEIRERGR